MKKPPSLSFYDAKEKIWTIGLHIFFILFCFLIVYPFWMVLVDSFDDRINLGLRLLPKKFTLEAYKIILTH